MELTQLLLLGAIASLIWLVWRVGRLIRGLDRIEQGSTGSLALLQREVQSVRTGVDDWLRAHLERSGELNERLGRLQEATKDVERLGAELTELQRVLRPPQLRGAFGERLLEGILADALPRSAFELQHVYPRTGVRVDAAVRLGNGRFLPIDSKFPLENFRRLLKEREQGSAGGAARRAFVRDVRKHIDAVADRYLSPEDGTLDVAFAYVPSEAVFQEIVRWRPEGGRDILGYAHSRNVIPVSPGTLHAYLAAVRMGLRGFRIQEDARRILEGLKALRSGVSGLRSELETAERQAAHSLEHVREAARGLDRMERDLARLTDGGAT